MHFLRFGIIGLLLVLATGAWAAQEPLRFAIFADINGGERPGVFDTAVQRINLLQPDFVMCVGDLIPGYEPNVDKLNKQYEAFDARAAKFTVPFYRTVGNHDISFTNALEPYTKRYGRPYGEFMKAGVQFLILDSEDPPETMNGGRISEEQLAFFKAAIAREANPRWTFIFMHYPLWENAKSNWDKFEALLGERNYTVFAGHYHVYSKTIRNGHEYYILSTTAAGNGTQAPKKGIMEHLMWVTLTDKIPSIAVLLLDGVIPNDVVVRDPKVDAIWNAISDRGIASIVPVSAGKDFRAGTAQVRLTAAPATPLRVQGSIDAGESLTVTPATFDVTVPAGGTQTLDLAVTAKKPLALTGTLTLPCTCTISATLPDGTPATSSRVIYLGLLAPSTCPRGTVKVDGKLTDWKTLPYVLEKPAEIFTDGGWKGPADASCRFGVRADDDFVYIAVKVTDDEIAAKPGAAPWEQDGLELRFDARPDPARSQCRGENEGKAYLLIPLSPGATAAETINVLAKDLQPAGVQAVCVQGRGGYTAEVAIPMAYVRNLQPAAPRAFRFNLALNDRDGESQTWLSWLGDWRREKNVPGAGTFSIAE